MTAKQWVTVGLFVALVFQTSDAGAAPKKIAVLGLEVIDDGSSESSLTKTTDVAKLVTEALRDEVGTKRRLLRLAPNSRKDLLELKLLSNCSDEAADCMAQIGRELRSANLLYGKLERRSEGYWVGLTLFDVGKKSVIRTAEDMIPFREAQPGRVGPHASRLFARALDLKMSASVIVRVKNARTGKVYVDGALGGRLKNGVVELKGVTAGSHTLRVTSDGFEAREHKLVVRRDEDVSLDVVLSPRATVAPSAGASDQVDDLTGSDRTGSKILFWSATAATVAAGGFWTYTGFQVLSAREDRDTALMTLSGNQLYNTTKGPNGDDCDTADALAGNPDVDQAAIADLQAACSKGKKNSRLANFVAIPATVAFAAAAVYFGYRAYLKDDEPAPPTTSGVQFEPYVGPNVVGAGMTLKF